jgi:hypothetical protein
MSILDYFEATEKGYLLIKLKPKQRAIFLSKLPTRYRKCYITDTRIEELLSAHKKKLAAKEIIHSKIPDPGSVMAGEFGEITSYFALKGKYLPLKLIGPPKWRWKIDRNKALMFTDIVMFHRNITPSEKDLIVLAEVKTKSTKQNRNPIQEALDGLQKDYVSRLARTLSWLRDIFISVEPNTEKIEYLDRFINSQEDKYGKYSKHYKAVAVIDSSFLDGALKDDMEDPDVDGDCEVVVIAIDDLKDLYESVYNAMPETYE